MNRPRASSTTSATRWTERPPDDYIFGVTAGNDVSERIWQGGDIQWLRGKASDTFAPLGAVVPGDALEVELEGVVVLRNPVAAAEGPR